MDAELCLESPSGEAVRQLIQDRQQHVRKTLKQRQAGNVGVTLDQLHQVDQSSAAGLPQSLQSSQSNASQNAPGGVAGSDAASPPPPSIAPERSNAPENFDAPEAITDRSIAGPHDTNASPATTDQATTDPATTDPATTDPATTDRRGGLMIETADGKTFSR